MTDRVALVTGAAQGIGQATAEMLASKGMAVVAADRNLDGIAEVVAGIQATGHRAIALHLDVTDSEAVVQRLDETAKSFGDISVLVNNVGGDELVPFQSSDELFWDKVIELNFTSMVRVTHAVLPAMVRQGWGRIVNISSDAGRIGTSLEPLYTGAKGGVIAFAKTLAREVARDGVTVNTVCPGMIDTPALRTLTESHERLFAAMTQRVPVRRPGEPRDIAAAVAYFASDDAGYVTGQTLSVNGGLSMV